MLVIVAPLYVPLVDHLGFDLIWYGVLYTITTQIAYMTPPFGYNLFLMRAMAPPEITLKALRAATAAATLCQWIVSRDDSALLRKPANRVSRRPDSPSGR
mgnify:CR=1 FL=1